MASTKPIQGEVNSENALEWFSLRWREAGRRSVGDEPNVDLKWRPSPTVLTTATGITETALSTTPAAAATGPVGSESEMAQASAPTARP